MSIAGEHAGRPARGAGAARRRSARPPVREAPPPPRRHPRPHRAGSRSRRPPQRLGRAARTGYVRPSQRARRRAARRARQAPAARPRPAATTGPRRCSPARAAAGRAAATAAPPPRRRRRGEPDIPLPPEPTDDEDWPHPASPAATRAAAARTDAAQSGATPAAAPPRAAAESSPVPRGGEPTPVVSANPEPAADGELTTSDVRRVWPELLAVVKRHKRTTEALLKSAQVHELANGVLTLATTVAGAGQDARRRPEQGRHPPGAQRAARRALEGDGRRRGRRPPRPAHRSRPEQAREAARAAEAAEASRADGRAGRGDLRGDDREPEPAVDPEQAALSLLRAQLGARPVDS